MKAIKFGLAGAGLVSLLILLPNTASARTHFHISFGTAFIDDCSGPYIGSYPHYRWHRGHYRWLDRGWYRGHYAFRRRHCWWRRPLCSSEAITKKQAAVKTREYDEETARLFEQLRRKKSELLKKLKEANKEQRKEAIDKLAGFSYDDKVREALEDILLSEPDAELRRAAVKSFGKVKNKKAIAALEKAKAEDRNKEVREEADKAIKFVARRS